MKLVVGRERRRVAGGSCLLGEERASPPCSGGDRVLYDRPNAGYPAGVNKGATRVPGAPAVPGAMAEGVGVRVRRDCGSGHVLISPAATRSR